MKDYRLKENREEYFTKLYKVTLDLKAMPGMVYGVMPYLVRKYDLDEEQRLWVAALNGNTQHILTTWRIFKEFPEIPKTETDHNRFKEWFDSNWESLRFDDDRKYGKKLLPDFVKSYSNMVKEAGDQQKLLTGSFKDLWNLTTGKFVGFGRLTSYSYLEYVKIMSSVDNAGYGADCDSMFYEDKSGSKSHRNGVFFLLGMDNYVWDKRQPGSHDGNYGDMKKLSAWLTSKTDEYLARCGISHPDLGYFTMESCLCTTKNHYYGRRYPLVYADMFLDRIKWYDDRGFSSLTKVFKEYREENLPEWAREECESKPVSRKDKGMQFADTGVPFRAEHFM